MYYSIDEQECFIKYETRGAAERFISDKARIASILNSFKNDPFYTHFKVDIVQAEKIEAKVL